MLWDCAAGAASNGIASAVLQVDTRLRTWHMHQPAAIGTAPHAARTPLALRSHSARTPLARRTGSVHQTTRLGVARCALHGAKRRSLSDSHTRALYSQPADVCKARIQTTTGSANLVDIARAIWVREGARGLWAPGVSASMVREVVYCGPRVGLYPTVRDHLAQISRAAQPEASVLPKAGAALATGTLGACVGKRGNFKESEREPSSNAHCTSAR